MLLKKGALLSGKIVRAEFDADLKEAAQETGTTIITDAENDRLILRGAKAKRDEATEMLKEMLAFYGVLG